jgi:tubulin-specific chaperone D
VQKAHYKTANVRKLEASVKVYGGLLEVHPEAIQKLTSMLLHPFPKVRDHVADVLFVKKGVGKGVNWTKASKEDLNRLLEELKE